MKITTATTMQHPRRSTASTETVVRPGHAAGLCIEGAAPGELATAVALGDDIDPSELELELPGGDLSGEELVLALVPEQADEFTCTTCWLVQHVSRRVNGADRCRDCST
jgi:hypothetical protein